MTPFYSDDWLTLYGGDCRTVMAELPADSVDCVVTSPPYWGLRDYGTDGQFGLERTPEEYVANLVAVFAEVWRVLKPSGTCWLNLGDSYGHGTDATRKRSMTSTKVSDAQHDAQGGRHGGMAKQLIGIPWRVAFALQADGWYLRSDIIWSKPNPMPESVTDRPTKSHEMVFLLTKSARYYFDSDAVREAGAGREVFGNTGRKQLVNGDRNDGGRQDMTPSNGRNLRSVWTIATRPYPGAHFAVFPPELPERCIKAGSSERGVCPECGAPWERVVRVTAPDGRSVDKPASQRFAEFDGTPLVGDNRFDIGTRAAWNSGGVLPEREAIGWRPTCGHRASGPGASDWHEKGDACEPLVPHYHHRGASRITWAQKLEPAVVLDPFAGSGTVGMVANRLSRRAILIDLNPEYLRQQMERNAQTPLGLGAA